MKNTVTIILIILIIAVAGMAAYLYFFVSNNNTAAATEPVADDAKNVTYYSPGDPFTTNLKGGRRYIKVDIQMELHNKSFTSQLDKNNAEIRDVVYSALRDSTEEEIDGSKGQDNLRKKLVKRLNTLLGTNVISNIYFTDFVIQ
jgi:flagellar FliL protein